MGWPQSSFSFKVKIKDTFFIFTLWNFIEQCMHHFVPLPSDIFSGNFTIPSFPNFYLWAKNCFRCILQSSSELKIFFHEEAFVKTETNVHLEVQCLVNKVMNQNFPAKLLQFLPGHQRNLEFCITLMEDYTFSVD